MKKMPKFIVCFLVCVFETAVCQTSPQHSWSKPKLLAKSRNGVSVYLVNDFLSGRECRTLLEARKTMFGERQQTPLVCFDSIETLKWYTHPFTTVDFTDGTVCVNESVSSALLEGPSMFQPPNRGNRITYSTSMSFYPGESSFTATFEARIRDVVAEIDSKRFRSMFNESLGGKYQITNYQEGQGYAPHTDCVMGKAQERDRGATVLVYLEDTAEGGETIFPRLGDGLSVRPTAGSALLFNDADPKTGSCLADSIHEAAVVRRNSEFDDDDENDSDVLSASKTILQRFYYKSVFPSLGKRVPEPPLPMRRRGQFKVACDAASPSSYCRLYNEWGYDTLVSYRKKWGFGGADVGADTSSQHPEL
jgi:prolyl 4-hydroxylase